MSTILATRRIMSERSTEELESHALAIISFLYNRVVAGAAPAVRKRVGLSVTEAKVVFLIGANGSTNAKTLTETLGLDKGAISRAINRLIDLGHVTSERDPRYGSRNIITLTEAGLEACEAIAHFTFAREERLLSVLTQKEQKQFLGSLRKIFTNVQALNELVELGDFWE